MYSVDLSLFHLLFWFISKTTPNQRDMGETFGIVDMSWQQGIMNWLLETVFNVPLTVTLMAIALVLFYGARKV